MIAEYIDREKALECLKIARFYCPCAYDEISGLPAADVAPVRHGRWVHDNYEDCSEQFEIVKCTNCGHKAYAMAIYVRGGNYCPNCGARMDLEVNDG